MKSICGTRKFSLPIYQNNVLEKARAGIYSKNNVDSLPLHWRRKYFHSVDESNYAILNNIKNEVIFRKFNLMNEHF